VVVYALVTWILREDRRTPLGSHRLRLLDDLGQIRLHSRTRTPTIEPEPERYIKLKLSLLVGDAITTIAHGQKAVQSDQPDGLDHAKR